MIKSDIETDDLPKTRVMVWLGHVLPGSYLISWLVIDKSRVVLHRCKQKLVSIEGMKFEEHLDEQMLKKIKEECFPSSGCLVLIDTEGVKLELPACIPLSEIERVGLTEEKSEE